MKSKVLMILMLGLAAANALADEGPAPRTWGERGALLAQLSPEERRALRERWELMPAEERAALRDQFRDRLQNLPPEERERRRQEIIERWREQPADQREARWREWQERRDEGAPAPGYVQPERPYEGFGRGYEQRSPRNERPGRR